MRLASHNGWQRRDRYAAGGGTRATRVHSFTIAGRREPNGALLGAPRSLPPGIRLGLPLRR